MLKKLLTGKSYAGEKQGLLLALLQCGIYFFCQKCHTIADFAYLLSTFFLLGFRFKKLSRYIQRGKDGNLDVVARGCVFIDSRHF